MPVIDAEVERCDRELAEIRAKPQDVGLAYLCALGELDWMREREMIIANNRKSLIMKASARGDT